MKETAPRWRPSAADWASGTIPENIMTISRRPRDRFATGTKYGNYNAWLSQIGSRQYQILAAFDPDHVPEKSYLTRVLGYFRDPLVAYVQAPQVYYNQDASFIAQGAAEESYAYYSTHLMASYGLGQTILVGSHTTQRISALMEVGGFAAHDADDLLITLRYRASRWEGIYLPEILALGMTPVDWDGYLRQQIRWVRSVIDIKLHVLPRMMGDLSLADRFLGLFHGAYYLRAFTIPIAYAVLADLLLSGRSPAYLGIIPLACLAALMVFLATVGLFRRRFFLDPQPGRRDPLALCPPPIRQMAVPVHCRLARAPPDQRHPMR